VPPGLPPILADAKLLRQVMVSLLANAYKFSLPRGLVRVDVQAHHTCTIITVTDQGRGIPREKLERIFDPVYQADDAPATRRLGGMDIGLAESRAIIVAHGGHLWAESQGEGHGSSFHVSLPLTNPKERL
jgi:two-component system sensor histidine kinase VicK